MSQLITSVPLPLATSIIFPAVNSSLVVPAVRRIVTSARPVTQPRRPACARPHPLARIDMDSSRLLVGRKHVAAIQVPAFQRIATSVTMGIPDKKQQEIVTTHFKASDKAHPLGIDKTKAEGNEETWDNPMGPSVWSKEEVSSVKITHLPVKDTVSTLAYGLAQTMRHTFDLLAGFKTRTPNEDMYLNRIIFLETVAAVPGMVAAMLRHLHSLRRMERDHGWIHTLLEEAENERMHLLTFIKMKQPGILFRGSVLVVQGALFNLLFVAYLIKPKFCHRLVGYIEEEAVKTYTGIIDAIDAGKLPGFKTQPVPKIAIDYWRLAPDASFRDLILAVRADEANHRLVNHTFATMDPNANNPFISKKKVIDESVEVPNKH